MVYVLGLGFSFRVRFTVRLGFVLGYGYGLWLG